MPRRSSFCSKNFSDTGKNVNPDWTGGITTSLSAYGFTLSAALDIRKGGYMFSRTKNLMQFTGNGEATLYNDRNPFIIPNSVYADGTENTTPIYVILSMKINFGTLATCVRIDAEPGNG